MSLLHRFDMILNKFGTDIIRNCDSHVQRSTSSKKQYKSILKNANSLNKTNINSNKSIMKKHGTSVSFQQHPIIADSVKSQTGVNFGMVEEIINNLRVKQQKNRNKLIAIQVQLANQMKKRPQSSITASSKKRYPICGDLLSRNEIWMRQRDRKRVHRRDAASHEQFRQCTFSPQIYSKRESDKYLSRRSSYKKPVNRHKQSTSYSIQTSHNDSKREVNEKQYGQIKSIIKEEIGRSEGGKLKYLRKMEASIDQY